MGGALTLMEQEIIPDETNTFLYLSNKEIGQLHEERRSTLSSSSSSFYDVRSCRSRKPSGILAVILIWWCIVLIINTSLLQEVISFRSSSTTAFAFSSYQYTHPQRMKLQYDQFCCDRALFRLSCGSPSVEDIEDDGTTTTNSIDIYDFYQKDLSIQSFNKDLRSISSTDPRRAHAILDRMEKIYQIDSTNSSTMHLVEPDSVSYSTVIEGWFLHKIEKSENYDISNSFSTKSGMTEVRTRDIDEIADCNSTVIEMINAAAYSAQSLLNRMEDSDRLVPSGSTYCLVCQKWAESYSPMDTTGHNMDMARVVLESYERFEQQTNAMYSSSIHLSRLYTIVLEGWCRLIGKVPRAMAHAEALLEDMENLTYAESKRQVELNDVDTTSKDGTYRRRHGVVGPNSVTYTSIIVGLSQSKQSNKARKADAIIDRMRNFGLEPDVVVYTAVLNCWAKTKSHIERECAASRALELLQEMEDSYIVDKNHLLKPSLITYITAIKAIGYSLDPNAPELAEKVLRRMYNLTESGSIHVPPNVATYNAVIHSLSTSGSNRGQKGDNARKAEGLLVEMVRRSREDGESSLEPSVVSWGSVLRAYSLSGLHDSGEQAQRIVDMLELWYESGNSNIRPNVVCYTTVISAWARGKEPARVALEKVNEILALLETLYEDTLDESFRPNKITYITAIDVYCRKSPDVAGSMSQNLVNRMLQLYTKDVGFDRPTRIVFNTLINAWSRSQEANAAEHAEKVFRWMESQYIAGDELVKPDEVTLCAVLNAWANNAINGGAMRAQQIMDHTEALTAEERGFDRTIIPWNILIKAWGRSKTQDSIHRAEKILNHLEERYQDGETNIKPDITTYSSVINCCAYYTGPFGGRSAAFDVAWRTFRRIKESDDLTVNNIVYGTLFKAIGKLTVRDRKQNDMIEDLFKECCQSGQVCIFVLSQVRSSSSTELFRNLLPESIETQDARNLEKILNKMPREWSRNVIS